MYANRARHPGYQPRWSNSFVANQITKHKREQRQNAARHNAIKYHPDMLPASYWALGHDNGGNTNWRRMREFYGDKNVNYLRNMYERVGRPSRNEPANVQRAKRGWRRVIKNAIHAKSASQRPKSWNKVRELAPKVEAHFAERRRFINELKRLRS